MMHNRLVAAMLGLSLAATPALTAAQEVSISRSVLTDLPYTLIFPAIMQPSGGGADPVTLNHPEAPLQCDLTIVPVEDTSWSAESALSELDDAEVAAGWADVFPGFSVAAKGIVQYQDAPALTYEGTSTGSAMGMPLTLVHTETVSSGRGYVLDCIYAADQGEQARPIVDFIIANFATRSDADCCVGLTPASEQPAAE